jgi:hypothetical protein
MTTHSSPVSGKGHRSSTRRRTSTDPQFLIKLLVWLLFILLGSLGFLKSTDFPFWMFQ